MTAVLEKCCVLILFTAAAVQAPFARAVELSAATAVPSAPPTRDRLIIKDANEPKALRRYYFPVQPPSAASFKSEHHDYAAADIFAPVGTIVVAVTFGRIDSLSRDDLWSLATDDPARRGGLFVSIVGEDGVRYYGSHLSAVAEGLDVGMRVRAGQAIGTVGNSGNARTVPPHLHFGISRPTFADDWEVRRGEIAPWDYLNAWKEGIMMRPTIPNQ
jgi:murein DD-endopeptidase MepM/ murein hydrolase activator NlpD